MSNLNKDSWSEVERSRNCKLNFKMFLCFTVLSQNGCQLEIHVDGLRRAGLARYYNNLRQEVETGSAERGRSLFP